MLWRWSSRRQRGSPGASTQLGGGKRGREEGGIEADMLAIKTLNVLELVVDGISGVFASDGVETEVDKNSEDCARSLQSANSREHSPSGIDYGEEMGPIE